MNKRIVDKCCLIFAILLIASMLIAGGSYFLLRVIRHIMFVKLCTILFYTFSVASVVFFVLTVVSIILYIVASVSKDE